MKKCIELPEELVNWLEEFSRQIGMKPDNFIAGVLYRYYDAWRAGRESVGMQQREEAKEEAKLDLDEIVNEFTNIYKKWHNVHIVKSFALWLKDKGLEICKVTEDHISEFLQYYEATHRISPASRYTYRRVLKMFLAFAREKLASSCR
jgi:hypothetical protein